MRQWTVTLMCIKCRGDVRVQAEGENEIEAFRRAETEHNRFHEERGDLSLWPDFCCWATAAN